MSVTAVVDVMSLTRSGQPERRFDPANSRQYPRTVARTWRYGCDPAPPGAAPVSNARRTSLPTADRVTPVMTEFMRAERGGQTQQGVTVVAKGKRTFQPNNRRRARVHGFRLRMRTRAGRAIVSARRGKGRRSLTA